MAIPDAAGGDYDKLSDAGDSVGQAFKLPDALRTEAHSESLSAVAPKSDVLPQVALTQPVTSTTPQIDTLIPLKVADTVQALAPNQITVSSRLDRGVAQAGDGQKEVAAATSPPANTPPLKVADTGQALAPNQITVSPRLDRGVAQAGDGQKEVAAATSPPANTPPLKVADTGQALAPNQITGSLGTDSGAVQAVGKQREAAEAGAATSLLPPAQQIGLPPITVADTRQALAPNQITGASGADKVIAQTTISKPTEVAAVIPPLGAPPPPASTLPITVADTRQALAPNQITGASGADKVIAQTTIPKPTEVAAVIPPLGAPPPPASTLPITVADTRQALVPNQITGASGADKVIAQTTIPKPTEVAAVIPLLGAPPPPASTLPITVADTRQALAPNQITGASGADKVIAQTTIPKPTEVAAVIPPLGAPPPPASTLPITVADTRQALVPNQITGASGADKVIAQTTIPKPTEVAAVIPSLGAPPPPASTLPITVADTRQALAPNQITGASGADKVIAQTTTQDTSKVATAVVPTISATIASAQSDTSTPGKVLDKLASAATQPQQVGYAVGPAAPKTESSETSGITPTPRIHTSSQFAVTREATQNITAGMQSYAAATASQDSKAQHASSIEKEVRTAALQPGAFPPGALPPGALPPSAFPPSTQPGIPGAKEIAGPPRSNDPQSLLAAMENAASRKVIGSVGTGETAPPQGKPATASLSGAQIADVSSIKQQDATSGPIIRTDVHGRILPPTATTGEVHTTQAAATPGAMPPLEGRVAQNVVQPGQHGIAPDSKSGTADTRKGLEVNPTTPGVVGQGVSTGKEHDDTKRILDVPNLNLDDKTQHTGEKGKTHVADQSNTDGSTPTQTKAETELANLFDRAKKDKKEQPEEADNIDTAAAAQQWVNTKRLEHKLRKGETLDLVSRKYFGDDMASTLIVELNPLVLNPRMHEHRVIISLPANSIIVIPFPNEVERFRKQLVAGTRTRMNIVYE